MKKGFALLIVLITMSGLLVLGSLVLQQSVMSYLVAIAQYHAYQQQYARPHNQPPDNR